MKSIAWHRFMLSNNNKQQLTRMELQGNVNNQIHDKNLLWPVVFSTKLFFFIASILSSLWVYSPALRPKFIFPLMAIPQGLQFILKWLWRGGEGVRILGGHGSEQPPHLFWNFPLKPIVWCLMGLKSRNQVEFSIWITIHFDSVPVAPQRKALF